jgi:RHH-type transcriptional regulator, proline utilization regulon repressor / proline dehydrogenase / delta 1-pyrroline-5-carboxylate dehydrogenase
MADQGQETAIQLVQNRVLEIGGELLNTARASGSSFWARSRWEETLSRKLMSNEQFRVQALRFIDVLPVLQNDADLAAHVHEYFADDELPLPAIAKSGLGLARGELASSLLAKAVRAAIRELGKKFIGGEVTAEAIKTVENLRKKGMAFTIDVLGEATVSEPEAETYQARYLELLSDLEPLIAKWPERPLLDCGGERELPKLNLSVKLSSLYSQFNVVDPQGSAEAVKERLRPILLKAKAAGAFICLDMEAFDAVEITMRVFRELMMEPEFRDWPDVGIAMQGYLRETEGRIAELIEWTRERGTPVTVRLVRGAYWDMETVIARQNDWLIPVWTDKQDTDIGFERCLDLLLKNYPVIETAVATHNVRSLALGIALAEHYHVPKDAFELQMLYGMADTLKDSLAKQDRRLRVYVPFGELIPGMAYLVRRLLENTASQSFLRMGFGDNRPADILLAEPVAANAPEMPERDPNAPFHNTSVRRFADPAERKNFAQALQDVKGRLGQDYPLIIDGKEVATSDQIDSVNPSRPQEIVGRSGSADIEQAEAAVQAAVRAFPEWRELTASDRAGYLRKTAALMKQRRDEFSVWEVYEAGKSWREADADVVEAIDFLEYYAAEAERLDRGDSFHVPGELNDYHYQPRGVGVIIPPWNFPLAILTGMLSAAIVTGNTTVLKPASPTPIIGAKLMELFKEVGLPPGIVNFLPGPGRTVGDYLVQHPQVHFITFTGSREIGCRINRLGAEVAEGQLHLKRVIAEMGGKNAAIIDSDADVDDAVLAMVSSGFGYQGQKCSAASRVVVVGDLYDTFVRRMVESTASLRIGFPEEPGNFMGPVITAAAQQTILQAIEQGKKDATLALSPDASHLGDGYFIGPTVFTDVPPMSALAQEEIFGPVVAIMRAKDLDEALDIANNTAYALTGGLYSRSPSHLEEARRKFQVGNLYLNRKITGAIVGRQPFGGYRMSGIGSKAGGPDYLMQFLEPRTITENTLRRGFAPE